MKLDPERVTAVEKRLPGVLNDLNGKILAFLDWMTGPLQE